MIHITTARLWAEAASASLDVYGDRAVFFTDGEIIGSSIVTHDSISGHAFKRILGEAAEMKLLGRERLAVKTRAEARAEARAIVRAAVALGVALAVMAMIVAVGKL